MSRIPEETPAGREPGPVDTREQVQPAANESRAKPARKPQSSVRAARALRWRSAQLWWVLLIAILVLGVGLRTRGLAWDNDQHLHPDERFLTMVETAIRIPASVGEYLDTARSPLNPYNNGFSLFIYGTAPLFIVRVIAEITHQTGYGQVYLVGRLLSALSDSVVLLMVFALGRRMFGLRAGLLAAFLYAVAVFPIQISHYFTVDTFTNVPLMFAFWFTLDIAEGRRGWLAYVLTGVFFGWMLASRINLALYAGIIILAALLRVLREASPNLAPSTGDANPALFQRLGLDRIRPAGNTAPPVLDRETHALDLGPLHLKLELEPDAAPETDDTAIVANAERPSPQLAASVQQAIVGLVLMGVATLILFRLLQPYAFSGLVTPNPQFLDNLATIGRQVSGQDDVPPGQQWAFRIPYWFSWSNLVVWGLGPALGLGAWAGVALSLILLLRRHKWEFALILAWVVGTFLYYGGQFVMTMRYLQPLYPFLALLAAFFLLAAWDWLFSAAQDVSRARRVAARAAAVGLLAVVLGYTLFWAVAFTSIYTRPNTRVTASRWILANVPDNAVLASEHWDDALPLRVDGTDYYARHKGVLLTLYDEDTPDKRTRMIDWMDKTDYIILSSNRLTDSILRLPMRYPLTVKYYDWLFDGQLGFEKAKELTSYPQLFGFVVNDDLAEEQFTVYDHPKVLIYKKTGAYSHDNTAKLFNSVDLAQAIRIRPIDATTSRDQFQLDAATRAADEQGGNWGQLFDANDLANRLPVPVWIALVWVTGLLAFPFTFVLFRGFADRGYAFSKALGILFAAWLPWTLSSYHLWPMSRPTILLALALLLAAGALILRRHAAEARGFMRANWRLLLGEELVFFAFFGLDLAIRFGNPDLWHPSFGGEKPMDFAYLNAILKSTWFPPYNPWFAGSYIDYYYFGQLMSAMLIRLSGIVPEVAYNLLLPTFFALTASSAFGVAFNLVASARRRAQSQDEARGENSPGLRPAFLAGLFAAGLVLIIGNLGEVGVLARGLLGLGGGTGLDALVRGAYAWALSGKALPIPVGDWYWTATRVIPGTINEFPFFSFLYADLHAHLLALPFTLVALALATHILFNRGVKWYDLVALGLVLGALRATNTWDYPTYLVIAGAALIILLQNRWQIDRESALNWSEWLCTWLLFIFLILVQVAFVWVPLRMLGLEPTLDMAVYILLLLASIIISMSSTGLRLNPYRLARSLGWRVLAVIVLSYLFYLPYALHEATAYTSIDWWRQQRTTLLDYLTVHGIFVFLVASFFVTTLVRFTRDGKTPASARTLDGWLGRWGLAALVFFGGLLVFQQWLLLLVTLLVAAGLWIILSDDIAPEWRWTALLMAAGLLLTLMVEVIVLKGDIGRMNTVFKFYLQAWVLFGVAGGAGLGLMRLPPGVRASTLVRQSSNGPDGTTSQETKVTSDPQRASRDRTLRWAWWSVLSLLLLGGLLYPLLATGAKVRDRYVSNSPAGLNGMDFMQAATYGENKVTFTLGGDRDAILWMRQNVQGSPVIAEGNTGLYHWGSRYSIYTGLPTIVGWDWHLKQQYSLLPGNLIDERVRANQDLYNTTDPASALEILRRYRVQYVIVGALERAIYNPAGLGKFQVMSQAGALVRVYSADGVEIYQTTVGRAALTSSK